MPHSPNKKPSDEKKPQSSQLPIGVPDGQDLPLPNVPVFRCVVYVEKLESGKIRGVVANLPDLEVTADSERSVLSRIVPAFKQRIIQFKQNGQPIPWIEPETPIREGQDKRSVPVHL